MPEISITRKIWSDLSLWSISIEEFLFLRFFNFLCLNWYFLGVDISCCHSHTDESGTFYNFIGVVFETPGAHPRSLVYRGSPGGADMCSRSRPKSDGTRNLRLAYYLWNTLANTQIGIWNRLNLPSPQVTSNVFFTTAQGNDLRYATSVFSITIPKRPTSERFKWTANLLVSM